MLWDFEESVYICMQNHTLLMKKVILALLAFGTVATANAQQDNSVLLYGNVGVHSMTDVAKNNTLNWNVNPGVGYQFNKNWVVGLDLGWGQSSSKDSGASDRLTHNAYNIGVFARYVNYFGNSNFFWYGQVNVGYQGVYSTFGSSPATDKANGIYANITPALGVMVGHGFALNFSVGGLGVNTMKPDGASNSNTNFDFDFGQGIVFGLSKNFGHHMHGHHHMGDDTRQIDTSDDSDNGDMDNDHPHHHRHHHKDNDDNNNDE